MFSTNPFAELSAVMSPAIMQGYVILMILLVIAGTILDLSLIHISEPTRPRLVSRIPSSA